MIGRRGKQRIALWVAILSIPGFAVAEMDAAEGSHAASAQEQARQNTWGSEQEIPSLSLHHSEWDPIEDQRFSNLPDPATIIVLAAGAVPLLMKRRRK